MKIQIFLTNYILLEQGQPLHAFDKDKLSNLIGKEVSPEDFSVRKGMDNESLICLDGKEYDLNENITVISCCDKPVAIAGVIGGLETSVTNTTSSIYLEGAVFNPVTIRKSSKAVGIRTESSSRYEKGISSKNTISAVTRAINLLEEYFSVMTSIVFANKGIVDKYMGDGIMAFFENPPDGVTSAQAAIKSAVAMQEKAGELDEKYKVQNRFPFSVYVGIATGYAKVGNIGPPEKVDYTVIGSVVNKASRLDGPGEPGDILMDEDTYFFVKDDYDIEDFGSHELKGFEKPVQIFKLKK